MKRRRLLQLATGSAVAAAMRFGRSMAADPVALPIALPGMSPGDGLLIRNGYATENTWYNPGYWHTGEDWYALDGDTAGASVLAIAAGTVVFAGSDYPGRVVIIQHDLGDGPLFSMYGHLDPALTVSQGDSVSASAPLGTVLARTDGQAPSHLHFEVRTFLTTPKVNGDSPRYGFACGFECAPGPGYWPIDAPEHPSAMGWRNPIHAIAARATWTEAIVAVNPSREIAEMWTQPGDRSDAVLASNLPLVPGSTFPLRRVAAGDPAGTGTSAAAYRLWFELQTPDGNWGWVQAAIASTNDTGSDGRPSSIRLDLITSQ